MHALCFLPTLPFVGSMATLPSQEMVSGRGIDTGDRESEGMAAPTNLDRPSPRDCEHTSPEFKGHAFLHIFTQERIPRLLRPIKAKIAAIHHAIKTAPSMGYIAVTQPPPLRSDSDRDSKSPVAERSSFRKAATMSAGHSYQIRSTRSSRNRFPECSASGSTITHSRNEIKKICPEPSTVPTHPTILSTANANDLHTRGDLLIKRFRTPLRDLFQDLVEKTWWHPFCDDHGIPRKTSPTSPTARRLLGGNRAVMSSLAVSCAFEVGRVVGHLAEDDVKTVEKYYGIVPSHLTRFTLLEHALTLCIMQVPIGELIVPLAEVCVLYRADLQALHALQYLLQCEDGSFRLDYRWAYELARRIGSEDEWINTLAKTRKLGFFGRPLFHSFLIGLGTKHKATLIQSAFEIIVDKRHSSIPERSRRSRLIQWTTMLIEDSLNLHAQVLEDDVLRLVNIRAIHRVIAYMAKSLCALSDGDLFAQRAFSNGRDVRDLSFALVLHSLYVAATAPEYSCCVDADKLGNDHDDIKAMGEWVQFLSAWISKTGGTIRTNDFDVIFKVYRTLVNLNALSITLEAVGLYALSMKLLDRMICDYGLLHQHAGRQTRSDSGPTIHELKRRRREMKLQTIQQQDHGRWRFDDIIGEWVELSPEPKKIRDIQVYSSEEEEEDHEDGLYKDPGDTQSSRRKVTRRTNISQALAKAKAQSKTFSLDDSSDDSDTPPPEVQRILDALLIGPLAANSSPRSTLALNSIGTRVRYSLTPVSRTYPLRPLTSGEGYEGEVHESDRNEDGSLAYSDYSSNSQNENEVDYTSLATTTTWGNMQRDFSLESSFDFDDQVDQVDQDSQDNHDNCAENYDPDDPDDEDYVQEPVRYHWDRSRARRGASRSDNESESDEDNDDLRLSENEDENSANIVQEERAIELYSSSNDEDGTIDLPPVIVLDDTDDDSDKDIRGENGTDINSDSYSDNNDGSESDVGSSDDRRIGSGPNRASTLYRATKHTIHEEDRDAYSNTENDEVFSRVNLENYPSPNVGRVAAVVIPSLKTMQDDMPSINGDDTIHEIPGIEKYSDEDYVDPGEKSMRRTTKRTLRRHPRRNLPYPAKKSNGHSIHSQPIDQSDDSSVENDPQHWKANQRRLRTRIRKTLPPSSNKSSPEPQIRQEPTLPTKVISLEPSREQLTMNGIMSLRRRKQEPNYCVDNVDGLDTQSNESETSDYGPSRRKRQRSGRSDSLTRTTTRKIIGVNLRAGESSTRVSSSSNGDNPQTESSHSQTNEPRNRRRVVRSIRRK